MDTDSYPMSTIMDSLTDPQTPPEEQTQPTPPLNGPSAAIVPEDTGTQLPPPPSDPHDVLTRAPRKNRDEKLRVLGKTFGNIPDVPIFTHWKYRVDCSNAAVHRPLMAGICGNSKEGAYSIVMSSSYQDDEDGGDIIIYTGAGGRERWTNTFPPKPLRLGPHTMDQSWDRSANKALIMSFHTGNPVRVIRSSRCGSQYAPLNGYRYDGLYKVAAYWTAKGRNGKNICRCRLERLPDQPPIPVRPITISTKRKYNKRPISYHTPSPLPFSNPDDISDKTDCDIQFNSSPAQLMGSTGGESEGLPNPPQQRAVSEASTRIDTNMAEVDHSMKVPQPLSPQRPVPSNLAALPRYKWDPKTNRLVKLPASQPISGDLGAAGGDEEDFEEEEDQQVEDDVTLVPSEVGHVVNEPMETECLSDTGNSLRYGTPDEPPASGSSALENQ